jgi:hypothetical protein
VKSSVLGDDAISMKMLEWAKDRISMGAERQSAIITAETMKLTAHHEAGHALVGILTEGSDPIHKATIIPRGRALGLVLQLPDGDQTSMTLKQMKARLDVCMGGRIAEEIMFGKEAVTSGASSDIQQATRLARAMVTKYGLSDKIGAVFINNDPSQNDRGTMISDETLMEVDSEIKRLCDESYARVTKLLTDNKHKLVNIAEGLIKFETLSGAEVVELANTGKLVADGSNGSIRSQKPSRELQQIPTEGVGGPKKRPKATTPAPDTTRRPAPALQRKLNPPLTATASAVPKSKENAEASSNPLAGFSSWFSAPAAKPAEPGSATTNNNPNPERPAVASNAPAPTLSMMKRGQTSTTTEVRVRNVNGKMVEESTTTVVSKDPQTGAISKTTTRRIRGPPVIVGNDSEAAEKKIEAKEEPKSPKQQ